MCINVASCHGRSRAKPEKQGSTMSLDVLRFLKGEFLDKYGKLPPSDPVRKILGGYNTLLKSIDMASLQGADKEILYLVKKILYDVNCTVDNCLAEYAESLHSMAKRSFRRCKQTETPETQKLKDKLDELKSTISLHSGSTISAPRKPASIPLLNYVVHGFQDQFDEIVKKISTRSQQEGKMQGAVGIVGIGGSGKTTLAAMVFNSREVREKYPIMIWASLTSTLNKKENIRGSVFMEILSGVLNSGGSLKTMFGKVKYSNGGGPKMGDHVLDKYAKHFKEALNRNSNKYLIVLDDVWETKDWFAENEGTNSILSREWIQKTGGTVMVTSRLEEMAENIVGKENLYAIKPVSPKACVAICSDRLRKAGLQNLQTKGVEEKCFGLPLAACTVADIMVAKHKDKKEGSAGAQPKAEAKEDALKEEETDAAKAKADAEEDALKKEEAGAAKAKADAEEDALKKEETDAEEDASEEEETDAEEDALKKEETDAAKAKADAEEDALKKEDKAEG